VKPASGDIAPTIVPVPTITPRYLDSVARQPRIHIRPADDFWLLASGCACGAQVPICVGRVCCGRLPQRHRHGVDLPVIVHAPASQLTWRIIRIRVYKIIESCGCVLGPVEIPPNRASVEAPCNHLKPIQSGGNLHWIGRVPALVARTAFSLSSMPVNGLKSSRVTRVPHQSGTPVTLPPSDIGRRVH